MQKARREMKARLICSFLFWIPLMYVSMYHMFYEWFSLPVPDFVMRAFHGPENTVTSLQIFAEGDQGQNCAGGLKIDLHAVSVHQFHILIPQPVT